ncbi:M1 family metallopeptidase [Mesoterricola silvestris]|uniref:Peptidase M1 membrane alanine aminopeptidase domain-containing protein n=1 Tax=Mesoterricola silvestris TaxID=2927979 RepID=A0AA48GK72_9BACT|nr:M1 family metallopeptidase [Mesoterricola silvestris]BDU74546.1 hypothetical protein METEAL_37200 [Mesoterricola silvestris]
MQRLVKMVLLALGCWSLGAFDPGHWFDKPKSPRIANYRIEAALDWPGKALEGRETISWRNTGTAATAEFPLHLYLNAFKGPQTIFAKEAAGEREFRRFDARDPRSYGYCRLLSVSMDGRSLDGHFGEDETVYWVRLGRAVAPGETIRLEVAWESRFPRVLARTGWSGDGQGNFLMGAQWFPKAGVYEGDRWICHAYHARTEFYADFGTYDVELSLPNALLLAHVGAQTNFKTQEDVTPDPKRKLNVIWKLHAEDVHDFAWAVMPSRSWSFKSFEYRGVQVLCYYQPENKSNLERQMFAARVALRHGAEWFLPYPYPVLSVVDVPAEAHGADGMEYPTLVTASSTRFDPFALRGEPEAVTVHEIGHQWFYGMLASNEVEEAWLDEGFTSWFTQRALERGYQSLFSSRRFQVGTDAVEHLTYWLAPSVDPISWPSFQTRDFRSYVVAAYAKPAMMLAQLEAMIGRPQMELVMQTYAREFAFRHPKGRDFRRVAERVTGRDLSAFWKDWLDGTDVLDMAIAKVEVREVMEGGWMDSPKGAAFAAPQPAAPGRRGLITLVRRGGIRAPITLWVRLEDRSERRLTWDGQDRWTTFEFDSPVTAAVLDPDGNYPMLKDRLHASYLAKPLRRGFHYWSQMVMGALTGLLQGAGIG